MSFPSRKTCTRCHKRKLLTDFSIQRAGKFGRGASCKECWRLYSANLRNRIRSEGVYQIVKTKVCTVCKERKRASEFFTRTSSLDRLESNCKVCHSRASTVSRHKLRDDLIRGYGGKCTCCKEHRKEFLHIDHKYNDGASERRKLSLCKDGNIRKSYGFSKLYRRLRKLGYPQERYQLLCANCNHAKGVYGYCPHEKERS